MLFVPKAGQRHADPAPLRSVSHRFLSSDPSLTLSSRHARISYEPFPGEEMGGFLLANYLSNTVSHLPRLRLLHIDIVLWEGHSAEAALFKASLANCPPFDVRLLEFDTNEGLGDAFVKQCTGLEAFKPSPSPFAYDCPTEPVLSALVACQPDLKGIHLKHNMSRISDGEARLRSIVHSFRSLELIILSDMWWRPYLIHEWHTDYVDFVSLAHTNILQVIWLTSNRRRIWHLSSTYLEKPRTSRSLFLI